MTDDSDRLDRIEALIESNAKSIQSLTESINEDRANLKKIRDIQVKDRAHVFEWMARLAAAQADFYEAQADYLHHVERIDDRMTEILSRLTPPTDNQNRIAT